MRIRAGMGPGKLTLESRILYEDMAALVDGDSCKKAVSQPVNLVVAVTLHITIAVILPLKAWE